MLDEPPRRPGPAKPPLHLWPVGILSLLWNAWGAFLALAAQTGSLPHLRDEERAYFAAQDTWLVIVADMGLAAGLAGALALLLQHRSAVWLFLAAFLIIALANLYDLAAGTSPMIRFPQTIPVTLFVLVLMGLQVIYARAMRRRGVLE